MEVEIEKNEQQKQRPILSWDELEILEDLAKSNNCNIDELKTQDIKDEMGYQWECLTEFLTETLEEKSEDGYWYVEVNGSGWRNLDGYAKLEINDGTDLIHKVLPDCDKTFHIYARGKSGLSILCSHHDSPTGEWYYLTPMTFEEYNNELEVSEDKVTTTYDVQDVIDAGYTLKPLKCRKCGSLDVVFNQGIGDAYCEMCGTWQLEAKVRKR